MDKLKSYLETSLEFLKGAVGEHDLPDFGSNTLAVIFGIVVVLLVGFSLGRSRMLIALVSLYIAGFLTAIFPWKEELQESLLNGDLTFSDFYIYLGILILAYALALFTLRKSSIGEKLTLYESSTFSVIVVGALGLGLLVTLVVSYVPASEIALLPSWAFKYFGTEIAQFIWAVIPLIGIAFLRSND